MQCLEDRHIYSPVHEKFFFQTLSSCPKQVSITEDLNDSLVHKAVQITVLHHRANKKKSVSGSLQNFGEHGQSSGTCCDKCFIMYCLFTFDLVCRGLLCDTGCSLLYIILNILNVIHS